MKFSLMVKKMVFNVIFFSLFVPVGMAQVKDSLRYDADGDIEFKGTLRNGVLDGIAYDYSFFQWYGKLTYDNGRPIQSIYYWKEPDSTLIALQKLFDSLSRVSQKKYYSENGLLETVIDFTYIDTLRLLDIKDYYASGGLKTETQRGRYQVPYFTKTYYENGKIESVGSYGNTYRTEIDTIYTYTEQGDKEIMRILTSEPEGPLKEGVWLYYDDKGQVTYKCYVAGLEVDCEDPRPYKNKK